MKGKPSELLVTTEKEVVGEEEFSRGRTFAPEIS